MKIKTKIVIFAIVAVMLGTAGTVLFFSDAGRELLTTGQNGNESIASIIETYTAGKSDVKLTIGVLKADKTGFKVFGADSKELEPVEHEYEIGSISKTFTASMLCKAVAEGRVSLDNSISKYLPLEQDTFYPTVLNLATHTSGYGEYPFDSSTLSKAELKAIDSKFYEKGLNIYQGIDRGDILELLKAHVLKEKPYGWEYSNFGIAVLGSVLSEVYDTSFKQLAEDFIKNELGLTKTRMGNGKGDLGSYWEWNDDDTYFAAGGIVSTVTDLLKYAKLHMDVSPGYLAVSHKEYKTFKKEGLSMGLGWIIDPETGYMWHNGGTSSYKSFIGIDKEHKTAVVVLSNYSTKDDSNEEDALDILGYALLKNLGDEGCDIYNAFD